MLLILSALCGSGATAAVVSGVGLEWLSEAHANILDRREWRVSASPSIAPSPLVSTETLRRAA
jgi:hypothetical protein